MLAPLVFVLVPLQAAPVTTGVVPVPEASARVVHLDEATRVALEHQPTVLQARASTDAAEGRSEQARSGLLPQITGSAQYQRIHGSSAVRPSTTTTGTPGNTPSPTTSSTTYDFFSAGLSASQLLWDFGQTYKRHDAAARAVEGLKHSERTSQQQVMLNVRKAYFLARAQHALVGVATEALSNEQKHFAQIQGFVSVGTRPEIDIVQERTTLANDRVTLITAQGNYEIARAQLNQSMGVIGDTKYDVADETMPAIAGEEGPDERLVETALSARPELAALQKQVESDELTIGSFKGGYGPTIAAVGGASYSGTAIDSLGPNWNVGAQLTWPLFQGGLTKGQVHEAQGNLGIIKAQLEQEKLQVRFDVEQSVLQVRSAKASIEAATDALTNARQQLRLAEGRYGAGVGSIIELGDAQVALTNAGAQLVQADFNLATARAQLLTSLGRP